jgi:SP family galactose:H+ symporter-like MFS transporter
MATQSMTVGAKSGSTSGGYKRIVYIICAVAALGGLLFGLDQGFIANSLTTIDGYYHLGVQGGERYSAILATGGIIGALLSGIFARFLGRKRSLLFAGFIFTAASALSAMLPSLPAASPLALVWALHPLLCRFTLPRPRRRPFVAPWERFFS